MLAVRRGRQARSGRRRLRLLSMSRVQSDRDVGRSLSVWLRGLRLAVAPDRIAFDIGLLLIAAVRVVICGV